MVGKLFKNARIYTPMDNGTPLSGRHQSELVIFQNGAIFSQNGIIQAIGSEAEVAASLSSRDLDMEVNLGGHCVIPGFVDPHTHMCFAATRDEEFALRIQGSDYLEILRRGGGILSSVRAVRSATEEALLAVTRQHVLRALRFGTTTMEIKSGYGLETQSELKMLQIINQIGRETPLDVIPTFLGAHAVPEEFRDSTEDYVDVVVNEMIPAVVKQGIGRFCDVFCERDVFTLNQSRRILESARAAGLGLKIHADEVHDAGGAGLAAELSVTSAEHLLAANDKNILAMAKAGVIAVLLPATAYSLKKPYARARKMIESNLPVALATDCNPGTSYTESMPFVYGLAVLGMDLSIGEALVAATLNAAYAIGAAQTAGSLDIGKSADFLVLDGDTPSILAYHAGVSPVTQVYKRGEMVFTA